MTTNELTSKFAELLKIDTTRNSEAKVKELISTRMVRALKLGKTCDRCGGSGHYSFNQKDGTVCYGCGGEGMKPRALTQKLYFEAQDQVSAGLLDSYIETLRLAAMGKKASDEFFKVWHPISPLYDWNKAAQKIAPHREISDLNKQIADMYHILEGFITKTYHVKTPAEQRALYAQAANYFAEVKPQIESLIEQARNIKAAFEAQNNQGGAK